MADIFDEVSEELRADRARQFFKQNFSLLIIAAVLVVAGAAGWQAWQWHQSRARDAVAGNFITAMRAATGPAAEANTPARREALADFERLAATGPEGYRALARLRAATLKAASGDLAGALALWDQVSADTAAEPELREAANYFWVLHQIDTGRPEAVQGRLAPLVAPGNLWRPLALESQALLLLRTGETDKARGVLGQIASDPQAPQGVRGRASTLLTRLGQTAPTPAGNAGG